MTAPDQRVSFLQGTFDPTAAFYPRKRLRPIQPTAAGSRCSAPAASRPTPRSSPRRRGHLAARDRPDPLHESRPRQPRWSSRSPRRRRPTSRRSPATSRRSTDRSATASRPPTSPPTSTAASTPARTLPSFDAGDQPNLIQLVVSGRPTDRCKGLTHYTLRGCREDVSCAVPDWDFTANPPAWWPCPTRSPRDTQHQFVIALALAGQARAASPADAPDRGAGPAPAASAMRAPAPSPAAGRAAAHPAPAIHARRQRRGAEALAADRGRSRRLAPARLPDGPRHLVRRSGGPRGRAERSAARIPVAARNSPRSATGRSWRRSSTRARRRPAGSTACASRARSIRPGT